MSGLSGASPAQSSTLPGDNVPPITFSGPISGLDTNSIIQKLTSLTLAQNVQSNNQITSLNAANTELIKINSLFASVQNALGALSDPALFSTFDATSSNQSVATAQGIPSVAATPGTYVIQSAQVATSTQVLSNAAAGHKETDALGGSTGDQVALANSYAAITPTNGGVTQGKVTIDGVTVNYDVNSQSIDTIFANINAAVQAVDPSFHIGFAAGTDTVQITGGAPISLGSAADQGNLLTVLKLDQAQINNAGPSFSVTGTSGVGGINQAASLNGSTAAGFNTPVTSGTFTINGVKIAVSTSGDNVASVLARINASSAGVIASYDGATNQITLTSKATGAQGIVLGSASDTSNFLTAAGLTTASGDTTTLGAQAKVVLQTPSGGTQTVFSNSNQVTTAIPGVQLNLLASTTTPFTVSVSQDSSQLVNAINTFTSSYNTVINEINQATAAPIVAPVPTSSLPGTSASSFGGGVLFGNADVETIKDQLESIASGFVTGNGTSFNSLSSIGLSLDNSFTELTTSNNGQDSGGTNAPGSDPNAVVQSTTFAGTSGQFSPLNVTALQNALAQNPSAVQNLFTGTNGIVTQLGTVLTGVTGLPTLLASGPVGNIPSVSLLQNFENTNTNEIQSLQQSIQTVTDQANLQADALRQEFANVESQIAGFQSLQQQLAQGLFSKGG